MSAEAPSSGHHHKKTTHVRGSKHREVDSPVYDASEEDNDPLTDDASAVSVPVTRHTIKPLHKPSNNRAKHNLSNSSTMHSDVDSSQYEGDIESSTTAGPDDHFSSKASPYIASNHHHGSASSMSVTSPPPLTQRDSTTSVPGVSVDPPSPAATRAGSGSAHPVFISEPVRPPAPPPSTSETLNPAGLSQDDIRAFVQKAIDGETWRKYKINKPPTDRPVRIYADGVYDLFHFGHALQLRQGKLSFPSTFLLVGVCSDDLVRKHKSQSVMTHAERCESARHCRWVDEVVPEAPWVLDQAFLDKYKIDYVAHDEDPYAGAGVDDVYAFVKEQGKFLPTRRTPGVSTSELLERIVSGYRNRDFDPKLIKMGHAELTAEGSDYDAKSRRGSQSASRADSPVQ